MTGTFYKILIFFFTYVFTLSNMQSSHAWDDLILLLTGFHGISVGNFLAICVGCAAIMIFRVQHPIRKSSCAFICAGGNETRESECSSAESYNEWALTV